MKSIHDCDQQEKMLRALLALDGLTYFQEDIMLKVPETPVEHFVHQVYEIAHSATGSCGNPHMDYLDTIDETFARLEKANIMTNVDQKVEDIKNGTRPKKHDGMLEAMKEGLSEIEEG